METFIIRLIVAVIPLITLIAAIIFLGESSSGKFLRRPLSYHRMRRSVGKAMAAGIMLR